MTFPTKYGKSFKIPWFQSPPSSIQFESDNWGVHQSFTPNFLMEVDEPTDGIYRKPIFGPTKKMRPSRKIDTAGKSPRQV